MLDKIRNMFGNGDDTDYKDLVAKGAPVVDVRTPEEFSQGHVEGSKNIPLSEIGDKIGDFPNDKNAPLIVICRSGNRSGTAKGFLEAQGYTNVHNGGGWKSFDSKLA